MINSLRSLPRIFPRAAMGAAGIALLLAATAPEAAAASKEGQYAIKGVGQLPCSRYTEERAAKTDTYRLFIGWLAGYMSAYNRLTEDTVDIMPWQSLDLMAVMMDRYCQQNSDVPFLRATDAAVTALVPLRLRRTSELVYAKEGEQTVTLYRETLRRAQQLLLELGHYNGTIEGLWDESTHEAFTSFQEDKKLQVTGLPDQITLLNLFK